MGYDNEDWVKAVVQRRRRELEELRSRGFHLASYCSFLAATGEDAKNARHPGPKAELIDFVLSACEDMRIYEFQNWR